MEQRVKHRLTLTERKHLMLEGVRQVGSFDEKEITLDTSLGFLSLKGEGLHITQLNLDEGVLTVEGFIAIMEFSESKTAKGRGKGLLNRILK
ncbi:forespore shell protein [Desulfocucumis palustris]|uniref:Forespore shell protein n=1 Tax=Desulfocucumis palustris TaxID=1898651 RepID=A0A2L2X8A6_9FIRM|nr:sporulation protein YabP [Desulfocucumis palustris]GBF32154.1 forespore shell protein [Desulfocucumis palustris]